MDPVISQFEELKKDSSPKKVILTGLLIGVLLLTIPFIVGLVQTQQQLRSRAGNDPISFTGTPVDCTGSTCTTKSSTVTINLDSPLGPPGTPGPSPTLAPAMFPKATFSVSTTTLKIGEKLTATASATPSGSSSISLVEIYYLPHGKNTGETLIGKCTTSSCTKTWAPKTAGIFDVYVDVHDAAKRACSNNPNYTNYTTTDPKRWANCGSSPGLVTVTK